MAHLLTHSGKYSVPASPTLPLILPLTNSTLVAVSSSSAPLRSSSSTLFVQSISPTAPHGLPGRHHWMIGRRIDDVIIISSPVWIIDYFDYVANWSSSLNFFYSF